MLIEKIIPIEQVSDCLIDYNIPIENALFFDIETTGFSAGKSKLYLIGCASIKDNMLYFKQWFLDRKTLKDEIQLLEDFFNYAKQFDTLIHYNGDGFDLPFLNQKAIQFQIENPLQQLKSLDLYKIVQPYKDLFHTENLKLKTMEQFLGIVRKDTMDGGKLIKVYHTYIESIDSITKNGLLPILLLHNKEDILNLPKLLPLLHYDFKTNGKITIENFDLCNEKEVVFHLHLKYSLPKRISKGYKNMIFTAFKEKATLKVPIYKGTLKYFFPNYKEYYYLPLEDTAIHKSVAYYVDKEFRIQAKASNCYQLKDGMFLPQFEQIISPAFKTEYKDRVSYIEISNLNLNENYVSHILQYIVKNGH